MSQTLNPLRAAIAGVGAIATWAHLPALKRHPDVELVALAELNPVRAQATAQRFGVPATYTDYATMLREEQPDIVYVCTPNAFHAPMSIAALEAGAHVLCEKPMALSVADAQAMVDAQRRTGKVLAVGLHHRFLNETVTLKRVIDTGTLGRVYYAKSSWLRRRGIPGFGSWFTNRDLSGGGALMDIGVHMLDLALWYMGFPRPVTVFGVTYQEFGPRGLGLGGWGADAPTASAAPSGARYDVDDLAAGMIRFENGATLVLDVSWAGHNAPEEAVRLWGTEAGAEVHLPYRLAPGQPALKLYHDLAGQPTDSVPSVAPAVQDETAQWRQLNNLLTAIHTGTPPRATAEHGLILTTILTALQQSAAEGRAVEITP